MKIDSCFGAPELLTAVVHIFAMHQFRRSIWVRFLAFSVTRLGDLLDFGQLFKAFGKNYFTQISHILKQFL